MSHELGTRDDDAQWIEGVLVHNQSVGGKGTKAKEIWWTVQFESPAPTPLCLSSVQVAEMVICAIVYREKLSGLQLQVGKELTVEWTSKDERACANGSNLKLRNCYLMKCIPESHMFMLRYRCGFEKIVDATSLVLLLEESIVHVGSNTKKIRNLVSLAEAVT